MNRMTRIETERFDDIEHAVSTFGDHEGVGHARVVRWMNQFDEDHWVLAGSLLRATKYYGASNIRAMTRELCLGIVKQFQNVKRSEIAFVSIGEPGSSSEIIIRSLRGVKAANRSRKLRMADLANVNPDEVSVIVFIDDFSGTGNQLREWWDTVEMLVAPIGAIVVVALLVMNYKAQGKIESFADECVWVHFLEKRFDVLSDENEEFTDSDQDVIRNYCKRTGCRDALLNGKGDCGLLVAFKHGCPNNSLPILWWDNNQWLPLFKRYAI